MLHAHVHAWVVSLTYHATRMFRSVTSHLLIDAACSSTPVDASDGITTIAD